jgi:hypothetical protein
LQGLEILRVFCQFGEDFHLYSAQKRFGSPETQAHLRI